MAIPVEPLVYEVEAARLLGIAPRALRSERTAGRITYRRVAGRVMYRADDLRAWQEGVACRARPQDRKSAPTRNGAGRSISSGPTPTPAEVGSVQLALAIANGLTKSSPAALADSEDRQAGPARVVPLTRR